MTGQGLDPVFRWAVKGAASGVGLVSESRHAHKEKEKLKAAKEEPGRQRSSSSENLPSQQGALSVQRPRSTEPEMDPSPRAQYENQWSQHVDPNRPGLHEMDVIEDQWELDDAQYELLPVTAADDGKEDGKKEKTPRDVKKIVDFFVGKHPLLSPNGSPIPTLINPLALPVILPQRRPKARSRGFVRAYAPDLEAGGIDQKLWFDFLDTFDAGSAAAEWLSAINLASFAGLMLPHGLGTVLSLAVMLSVKAAADLQSRHRTNNFLTRINNEFFRPRGLYCMIMTWRPDRGEVHETVNLTSTISSTVHNDSPGMRQKFKNSSGKTYGDFEFPEAAPLVYPLLDEAAEDSSEEAAGFRNKLKRANKFTTDYFDKRAQANYAAKNPDSILATGPKHEFHSRYADPSNPASNGSFLSFVSGGHINPPPGPFPGGMGVPLNYAWAAYKKKKNGGEGKIQASGGYGRGAGFGGIGAITGGGAGRGTAGGASGTLSGMMGKGPLGILPGFGGPMAFTKLLKQNVLYLMVVNMPTEKEMAAADAKLKTTAGEDYHFYDAPEAMPPGQLGEKQYQGQGQGHYMTQYQQGYQGRYEGQPLPEQYQQYQGPHTSYQHPTQHQTQYELQSPPAPPPAQQYQQYQE